MTSHSNPISASSHSANALTGDVTVPGDKSISHRSLMLGSQTLGKVEITGLLEGEDVIATANALRKMGVNIQQHAAGNWSVEGVGVGGLHAPDDVLDMGNAGTGARLMMGLLASYPFASTFTGDESLRSRPMGRIINPLSEMGISFMSRDGGRLPLTMQGNAQASAITYRLPMASAQVKSAVLLAGLNVAGITTVIEPEATRDHTERMLKSFGVELDITQDDEGATHISLQGQQQISFSNRKIHVPADPSSAAFPTVAALLIKGSSITLKHICVNPLRTGIFRTLIEMGADITYDNRTIEAGEEVADITVKHSDLHGIEVPAERAPSMIDEYPILSVAASMAEGDTIMHGLEELRVKESDRLQAIIDGLEANGVNISLNGDTLIVHGTGGKAIQGGGYVATHFDHRIAMSFLVLGMAGNVKEPVTVDDTRAIATSFPDFIELMNDLGANLTVDAPCLGSKTRVIAIDGPAASGKGTLARKLAEYYGHAYLDTGRLYRAVGLKLVNAKQDATDKAAAIAAAKSINQHDLQSKRLRQETVGNAASIVSAIPEVRQILLDYQRNYAKREGGAVLDGRDIGTVVCPDADIKLFVTASVEARAQRRHAEIQGEGIEVVAESVLEDLKERDARDSERDVAPLKPAADAIEIDTTNMSTDEVLKRVTALIEAQEAA